jgi:hypothetical protein
LFVRNSLLPLVAGCLALKPSACDEWVKVPAAQIGHPDYPKVARALSLTYAMIYQQPVVYEFSQIKVPTLVVIGQEDRTIVGKGYLKDKQKLQEHGQYPALGKKHSQSYSERETCGIAAGRAYPAPRGDATLPSGIAEFPEIGSLSDGGDGRGRWVCC